MPIIEARDFRRQRVQYEEGMDDTLSAGFLVTSGGSAHSKGNYTELIASADFPAEGMFVHIGRIGSSSLWLIDFAIGTTVIVPNLLIQSPANQMLHRTIYVPVSVSKGAQIQVRGQANAVSQTIRAAAQLVGYGGLRQPPPYSPSGRIAAYGVVLGTTRGTNVDPGGTIHTKGAWSVLDASTSRPIHSLMVAIGYNGRTSGTALGPQWLIDIGVGPDTFERVIVPNIWAGVQGGVGGLNEFLYGFYGPYKVRIPAGSRLVARSQCTTATAAERQFDLATYGVA